MVELYRNEGLNVYEAAHYGREEHVFEVDQILTWYRGRRTRILDVGCSGGLHALEMAKRGFFVTGIDREPSAIQRALHRNKVSKLDVTFETIDLETDDISFLGKFDLVYSIGNVLSHIRKNHIDKTLVKLRNCLSKKGILFFDVFTSDAPFLESFYEEDSKVHWQRTLNTKTGLIHMEGHFLRFGFTQHFEVWAYPIKDMCQKLKHLGFQQIRISDQLDFSTWENEMPGSICVKYRATIQ